MQPPSITIDIWMDGKIYGSRQWPAVPRKGDLIFLNRAGNMQKAVVREVVWGAAADNALGITVAIECRWKEPAGDK